MDLCSGRKDLTVPSIMFMIFLHGTLLSSGKPPGRPPDSDLVGEASQHAAPSLGPGGIGALEDKATSLEDLGKLKKEGYLLLLSSSPTHFWIYVVGGEEWKEWTSNTHLWHGRFQGGEQKHDRHFF